MRLSQIVRPSGPVPVSKSTWWAGVKAGRFPQPIKIGSRITCWRSEDIQDVINGGRMSAPETGANAATAKRRDEVCCPLSALSTTTYVQSVEHGSDHLDVEA
nr:AlpA family phage regulatory protein [Lichenibacterium minor]